MRRQALLYVPKRAAPFVLLYAVLIAAWWYASSAKVVSRAILASPSETLKACPSAVLPNSYMPYFYGPHGRWSSDFPHVLKSLAPDIVWSIRRSLIAFIMSIPIGMLAGFAIFYARAFRPPGEYLMDFLRSIPATVLVPFFLVLFGIGEANKIAVASFSSSLVICLATLEGLKSRNETRLALANYLKLHGFRRLLYFDIPEVLPQLFVGLRAGISLALILVLISELFGEGDVGIGKRINDLYYSDGKPQLFVLIIGAGTIGYVLNLALKGAEWMAVPWRHRD